MKVTLLNYTSDADKLLVFSKKTRHMAGLDFYGKVQEMTEKETAVELGDVFSTISSSWEFVDYVFLLEEVTRAFTHQLVRHRTASFAQQTQRGVDMRNFECAATGLCEQSLDYEEAVDFVREKYTLIVEQGIPIQDARGILPTNILTNILVKMNLRSLNHLMSVRLCVRAQGEFQEVVKEMKKAVLKVHPWSSDVLVPFCIQWGRCQFPRFEDCQLKKKFPFLKLDEKVMADLKKSWERMDYESQPVLGG